MTEPLTPAQQIDLEERIAILLENNEGMGETEATNRALEELEIWWEDLAT